MKKFFRQQNKIHWIVLIVIFVIVTLCFVLGPLVTRSATFSVDDTGDASDANAGDGICATAGAVCTLRAAIEEANALAGTDSIDFSGIDTTTQQTITVATALPTITEQITITAEGAWETAGDRPGIRITASGSIDVGLHLNDAADSSRISGLKIDGFALYGILMAADDSQIGLDCLGAPDEHQRNVIISNLGAGISTSAANDSHFAGNWVGVDEDGTTEAHNGTSGYGHVEINLHSSHRNVFGFDDGVNYPTFSCTADQARNVIGIGAYNSFTIDSESTKNIIAGNYFNLRPDGSQEIAYSNAWGVFLFVANYNWIGTNGNGIGDEFEGNVFGPYFHDAVYGNANGNVYTGNRISGNIFGGDPTGTSDLYTGANHEGGVRLINDSENSIIGYCDDSDDSDIGDNDMCSDGGTRANQANYFMGMNNTDDSFGILINNFGTDYKNYVYGNYFGVGKDSSSIPNTAGIRVGAQSPTASNYIYYGGAGDRSNTIKNNQYGVYVWTWSHVSPFHLRNSRFENNLITDNISHGVYLLHSKDEQANDSVAGIEFVDNMITDNGGSGIYMSGGAADIEGNTITGNNGYGIFAESVYNGLTSSYAKQTMLDASNDLVAEPILIGGTGVENTISGNTLGGIALRDTLVADDAAIYSGNTFADNNSLPAIKSTWWGAVEILDTSYDPITAGTYTVSIEPQSGSIYSGSAVDVGEFAGENDDQYAWGPTDFDYDDETTWFEITDYEYATDGTKSDYGPFTISVIGDNANDDLSPSFAFDGSGSGTNLGGLPLSYSTGSGIYRYQIAEAVVSSVPDQPVNSSPADGSIVSRNNITLQASAFVDTDETHSTSLWQIYSTEALCQTGSSGDVYDSGQSSDLLSHFLIPMLSYTTDYWWRVTYVNSYGNNSTVSTCTTFQTSTGSSTSSGTSTVVTAEPETTTDVSEPGSTETESTEQIPSEEIIELESEPELISELTEELVLGTFIKTANSSIIYYVNGNNQLHPVYNPLLLFTWIDSYDEVIVVTDEVFDEYELGHWMLPQSKTVLIKNLNDPKVYFLEDNADNWLRPIARWIVDEGIATSLLGRSWADYVIDLSLDVFSWLFFGEDVDDSTDLEIDLEQMKTRQELSL